MGKPLKRNIALMLACILLVNLFLAMPVSSGDNVHIDLTSDHVLETDCSSASMDGFCKPGTVCGFYFCSFFSELGSHFSFAQSASRTSYQAHVSYSQGRLVRPALHPPKLFI